MRGGTQWVAFRSVPGAMLKAPLPSAPEVGVGWRGVALRRVHPLHQFDALLEETGTRSDAAVGVHVEEDFAYAIATSRDGDPIHLLLGVRLDRIPATAKDAAERSGLIGAGAPWRKQAAKRFAAWTEHAPRCSDAVEMQALLGLELPGPEAAARFTDLLGIAFVEEAIPDPLNLQSVAREQLGARDGAGSRRRRWFSSTG
jgi:hypothetical protein